MVHRSITATVVDDHGRAAVVNAATFADAQMEFDPKVYLNEAALNLDIDGQPGIGWCEFCWNRDYFDFASDFVTTYG